MTTVACVLRGGGEYKPEHVRALYDGVVKHWPASMPLRFVALTDTPIGAPGIEERALKSDWPGWWSKLELFLGCHDDLGEMLYFDLDTMITGSLAYIACSHSLIMLQDFHHPERVQSGMMCLPKKCRAELNVALDNGGDIMRRFRGRGDGDFLDSEWRQKARRWQTLLPEQIISYKRHVRPNAMGRVPPNTRVVCFHGNPRPWNTPMWPLSE